MEDKIKAIEEYIKQLEHDIQMHRATDREYAKCLEQKLSGVNTVYYMLKTAKQIGELTHELLCKSNL